MARQARLDIPGGLYHVIARGNERREIFYDDADYKEFYKRAVQTIKETGQKCLAWALIPNHYHLLILRGKRPLSDTMRKLMTGYTVYFNRRHHRAGHLFQDRYKAVLCQEDSYLFELAAYIHLNPMRAGLVRRYKDLAAYRWCGHGEVMTGNGGLVTRDYLLEHFGGSMGTAVRKYALFMQERIGCYKKGEYSGGGLFRSAGGVGIAAGKARRGETELFDSRVLGSGDFVASVLKELDIVEDRKMDKAGVIVEVLKLSGLRKDDIFRRDRSPGTVKAKALYWPLVEHSSLCGTSIASLSHAGKSRGQGY